MLDPEIRTSVRRWSARNSVPHQGKKRASEYIRFERRSDRWVSEPELPIASSHPVSVWVPVERLLLRRTAHCNGIAGRIVQLLMNILNGPAMALYRPWKEFQATHLAEYLLSAAAVQAAFLLLRHPKTNYGTIPKGADRNPSLVCLWFDQYRYRLSVVSVTDFSNFLRRGSGSRWTAWFPYGTINQFLALDDEKPHRK